MDSTNTIVVVGASAGGVRVLQALVSCIERDWPIAMFITLHIGRHRSQIAEILNRVAPMRVSVARDGEPFDRGIYVAAPNRHLLITNNGMILSEGPKENYARPAIDPMFRSAAKNFGRNVIGVLLTGHLFDGMNGLLDIQQAGGCTIVQNPNDAEVPDIPLNAIKRFQPDYILPLSEIPPAIARCMREGTRTARRQSHE